MRLTLILATCVLMMGCATTPVIDEQPIIQEPIIEAIPEVTTVSVQQDGVIIRLRGIAYIHDVENEEYIVLRPGDRIPIGKTFYLTPKTTMRIKQNSGDELYLYSKEKETYYKLEIINQ